MVQGSGFTDQGSARCANPEPGTLNLEPFAAYAVFLMK